MARAATGSVRQLKSGRWQVRATLPDGTRRSGGTFATRRDAEAALRSLVVDLERAGDRWREVVTPPEPEAPALALSDYFTSWLDRREVRGEPLAEWTKTRYRSLFDRHISPRFGTVALGDLTPEAVVQWYAGLLPDKRTTRAHAYGLLRTLMRSAVQERLISESPVSIPGAGSSKRKRPVRIATPTELATIADAMPDRLRMAVLLGAWGSLRYGEVAELRRADIECLEAAGGDPSAPDGLALIHVSRGVTWPHSATKPLVGPPKSSAGVRTVALPPHLTADLRAHLDAHAQPGRRGLLFPSPAGHQIHQAAFFKAWDRARKAAGRSDLRFHDLRHTGATLAAQAGATVRELMARVGHSTPTMALNYQHASQQRDREIAARLSALAGE